MPRTPKDFGAFAPAKGQVIDNKIALQKWLSCPDHLLWLDTFYYSSEELNYHGDKLYKGVGINSCGILAHPLLPLAAPLLINKTISNDLVYDAYTTFADMTLGGEELTNEKRLNYCFTAIGFKALSLENILWRDWAFGPFLGVNLIRPKLKEFTYVRAGKDYGEAEQVIDITIR